VTAGAMLLKPALVRGTAANSAVRVGRLGCGGRGTEYASNMVDTGGARVVALADMFQDQLDNAKKHFDEMQQAKGYAAIDASQVFVGSNAFKQMAASKEVDAVVIATPPYYHRSEERRVGKECRSRWRPAHKKKKTQFTPKTKRVHQIIVAGVRRELDSRYRQ